MPVWFYDYISFFKSVLGIGRVNTIKQENRHKIRIEHFFSGKTRAGRKKVWKIKRKKEESCHIEKIKEETEKLPIKIIPQKRFADGKGGCDREEMCRLMKKEGEGITLALCDRTLYLCVNVQPPYLKMKILSELERILKNNMQKVKISRIEIYDLHCLQIIPGYQRINPEEIGKIIKDF